MSSDLELRAAERALQAAMLAGDDAALEALLDDRLIFTLGAAGVCLSKGDDLELHRTRRLVLTEVTEIEMHSTVAGRTGVTWFLGALAGTHDGVAFSDVVRFTRTWTYDERTGWTVLAAHSSPMPDEHVNGDPDGQA